MLPILSVAANRCRPGKITRIGTRNALRGSRLPRRRLHAACSETEAWTGGRGTDRLDKSGPTLAIRRLKSDFGGAPILLEVICQDREDTRQVCHSARPSAAALQLDLPPQWACGLGCASAERPSSARCSTFCAAVKTIPFSSAHRWLANRVMIGMIAEPGHVVDAAARASLSFSRDCRWVVS